MYIIDGTVGCVACGPSTCHRSTRRPGGRMGRFRRHFLQATWDTAYEYYVHTQVWLLLFLSTTTTTCHLLGLDRVAFLLPSLLFLNSPSATIWPPRPPVCQRTTPDLLFVLIQVMTWPMFFLGMRLPTCMVARDRTPPEANAFLFCSLGGPR